MKKCTIIASFLLIFSTLAEAQRHQLGLGAAYFSFTIENATGFGLYVSYLRPFGTSTYIGLSAEIASVDGEDEMGESEQQQSFAGSLQFLYALWQNDYQRLAIGAGFTGRNFSEKWLLNDNLQTQTSVFKPGLELLLDYSFFATESWIIGSRGAYQLYEHGNSVVFIGGSIGYQF